MSLQSWHARGKQRDEEPALDDGEDPFAFCPECGGRKRVWRTWEPGGGMTRARLLIAHAPSECLKVAAHDSEQKT